MFFYILTRIVARSSLCSRISASKRASRSARARGVNVRKVWKAVCAARTAASTSSDAMSGHVANLVSEPGSAERIDKQTGARG